MPSWTTFAIILYIASVFIKCSLQSQVGGMPRFIQFVGSNPTDTVVSFSEDIQPSQLEISLSVKNEFNQLIFEEDHIFLIVRVDTAEQLMEILLRI